MLYRMPRNMSRSFFTNQVITIQKYILENVCNLTEKIFLVFSVYELLPTRCLVQMCVKF